MTISFEEDPNGSLGAQLINCDKYVKGSLPAWWIFFLVDLLDPDATPPFFAFLGSGIGGYPLTGEHFFWLLPASHHLI